MKLKPRRAIFWVVFLAFAGAAFEQTWKRLDPLRNHPQISQWWLALNCARLASRDDRKAVQAWHERERLFLTRWSGYDWIVWKVKQDIWRPDDPRIQFVVRREGGRFFAARGAGHSECRTVTEALMAIVHQEPVRRSDYQGDWRKWWDDNWTKYPNRVLHALPSGPEDPRGPR